MAEEPFAKAIEEVLGPGRPTRLPDLEEAVNRRVFGPELRARMGGRIVGGAHILVLLRANPDRFVEVARGVWALRRSDGPEAGVRSPVHHRPLAGGAAAEAVPPPPEQPLDAVSRPPLGA
jgi:hypothetical protein